VGDYFIDLRRFFMENQPEIIFYQKANCNPSELISRE
jgi:hypothetical protein